MVACPWEDRRMAINPCGPRKISDIFMDHGIRLTNMEARVLDALLGRERLVSRDQMIEHIWPDEDGGPLCVHNILRVCVHRIRRKMRGCSIPWRIEAKWQQGYRLRYEERGDDD